MNKTKVAIYNCFIPYNQELAKESRQKLEAIKEEITEKTSDEVIGIFEDARPASTELRFRPELQKLLRMAERKEINEIVVPRVRQLSTSVRNMINIIRQFEKHGVTIKCLEEGMNSRSVHTKTALQIMALGTQFSAEPQADRVKNVVLYYGYETCCPDCETKHFNRIEECEKAIRADKSLNLVYTYTDIGIEEEAIMERGGIIEMMNDIKEESIDMVYAHSLESFASQTHDFITICKELEKYGVGVKVMEIDLTMQCDEEKDFGITMM